MSCQRGFLPCFSVYREDKFPIEKLYEKNQYVDKAKLLISSLIDSKSPFDLKTKIGQEIKAIRPESKEEKYLISLFSSPHELYRIDYGNNPFRVVFGLSHQRRMAFIYAFDTNHFTLSGKQR